VYRRIHLVEVGAVASLPDRKRGLDAGALLPMAMRFCILPERSAAAPGLVTRSIEGLSLERELVLATVSRSTTPVEIPKIAQLASRYEWQ
jgi:hypothetical protein